MLIMINNTFKVHEDLMTPQKISIGNGASLSLINTNKFNSSLINISFCVPLTAKSAALNMLLVGVI